MYMAKIKTMLTIQRQLVSQRVALLKSNEKIIARFAKRASGEAAGVVNYKIYLIL